MGEIADDMVNGASCEQCGMPFVQEHGYPATCKDCWRKMKKDGTLKTSGKKRYQKAIYDTV